jgi:eukaryotic-like serine/threonine-protein kinase
VECLLSAQENVRAFMNSDIAQSQPDTLAMDSRPSTLSAGQVICDRYQVLRFIGRGGMGEVYEAKDLELRTRVALKTVRPEISSSPGTLSRFKDEIRLARRITNRNVCRMYHLEHYRPPIGSGNPEITFIIMELLVGETLGGRLRRKGGMTTEEALPLVRQMAEGLDAAHEAGVVHCDFKPGNVMLVPERPSDIDSQQSTKSLSPTEPLPATGSPEASAASWGVVITDFGLARAIEPSPQESTAGSISGSEHLAGTPAYMSPEQLEGRKATLATDIYALGLVMYEMVTGHQPFPGDAYQRLREQPPSPRTHIPGLDQRWESAILRCLEREPATRYASAHQVVETINPSHSLRYSGDPSPAPARRIRWAPRRVLAAALGALVTLVVAAAMLWYVNPQIWQRFFGPALPDGKNLVVLPFEALDGRADEQARCDGFTDTVTAKLAQLTAVEVPAAASVRHSHVDSIVKARTQLGATLVLVASWQQAGKSVRINLSLVDAKTRRQLRTDSVTAAADDVFSLQDEVVLKATQMLELQLSPGSRKDLTTHGTGVLTAYDFYIQGVGYLQRYENAKNVDLAINLFQRAIAEDNHYALAQAALAQAYWYKYSATRDTQWADNARAAVEIAAKLDSGLPEVQFAIGDFDQRTGANAQAIAAFSRTIDLDPANAEAYQGLGRAYDTLGRAGDAEKAFRRAIEIRPACWSCYNSLGVFFLRRARYGEAVRAFKKIIELTPDNAWGYMNVGDGYLNLAEFSQAGDYFERGLKVSPDDPDLNASAGTVSFFLGRYEEDVKYCQKAIALEPQKYDYWGNLGDAYRMIPGRAGEASKDYRQAIALAEKQLQVNPVDTEKLSYVALYHARVGEAAEARRYLQKALALAPGDEDVLRIACLIYLEAGNREEALKWLGKAVGAGYLRGQLIADPELASLRSDPKFAQLVKEAKTLQ